MLLSSPYYYAALAAIHVGFGWGVRNAYVAARTGKRWVLGLSVALLLLLAAAIFEVYEIVPVLWWPDASQHFVERIWSCVKYIAGLGVLTFWLRTKSEPHPGGDAAR